MNTGSGGWMRFLPLLLVCISSFSAEVAAQKPSGAFCKAAVPRGEAQVKLAVALGCERINPVVFGHLSWKFFTEFDFREGCVYSESEADFNSWMDKKDKLLQECRMQAGGGTTAAPAEATNPCGTYADTMVGLCAKWCVEGCDAMTNLCQPRSREHFLQNCSVYQPLERDRRLASSVGAVQERLDYCRAHPPSKPYRGCTDDPAPPDEPLKCSEFPDSVQQQLFKRAYEKLASETYDQAQKEALKRIFGIKDPWALLFSDKVKGFISAGSGYIKSVDAFYAGNETEFDQQVRRLNTVASIAGVGPDKVYTDLMKYLGYGSYAPVITGAIAIVQESYKELRHQECLLNIDLGYYQFLDDPLLSSPDPQRRVSQYVRNYLAGQGPDPRGVPRAENRKRLQCFVDESMLANQRVDVTLLPNVKNLGDPTQDLPDTAYMAGIRTAANIMLRDFATKRRAEEGKKNLAVYREQPEVIAIAGALAAMANYPLLGKQLCETAQQMAAALPGTLPPAGQPLTRARVLDLSGGVYGRRGDGDWQPFGGPGSDLDAGWDMRTGADGVLNLLVGNDDHVAVGANSQIRLVTLRPPPAGGAPQIDLYLPAGSVQMRIAPGRNRDVKVSTPVASASVKGTEFSVAHGADGATRVEVARGSVEVRAKAESGTRMATPGKAIRVNAQGQWEQFPPIVDRRPPLSSSPGLISVQAATYGHNCGAKLNNVIGHAQQTCDGKAACDYKVDFTVIGDPASGCPKNYSVTWNCGSAPGGTLSAPPEAGYGAVLNLRCATGAAVAPSPTRPNDRVALKLYWSAARGDNFTTATATGEADAAASGYSFARVEGYAFREQQAGTVPLKLYWSAPRGDNFSTATSLGESQALSAGYQFARNEAWVYPDQRPGTVPLKNYWSAAREDNFQTATAAGEQHARDAGYGFAWIEGYVFPADAAASPSLPQSLGCFKDQGDPGGLQGRDLDGAIRQDAKMTGPMCVAECRSKGFAYAGTQYGAFCFCGNQYGRTGAANNCDSPCAGNPQEKCGGGWANSVYPTGGTR